MKLIMPSDNLLVALLKAKQAYTLSAITADAYRARRSDVLEAIDNPDYEISMTIDGVEIGAVTVSPRRNVTVEAVERVFGKEAGRRCITTKNVVSLKRVREDLIEKALRNKGIDLGEMAGW